MKYFLSHTEIFQLNLEYISQINSELDQLRRIRDLLQGGGGRLSLGSNDQIVVHPSPRSAVLGEHLDMSAMCYINKLKNLLRHKILGH